MRSIFLGLLALSFVLLPGLARAQAGSLDPSFGTAGITLTPVGDVASAARTLLLPDGRIVVAGFSGGAASSDVALARYTSSGTLDATFGTGGVATADLAGVDYVASAALQPNGKIVVVGYGSPVGFTVARFDADGSLDATFGGGDGWLTVSVGSVHDEATDVAVQPDGRIVVVGHTARDAGFADIDWVVARLLADGSPDASFGTGGVATLDVEGGADLATAVALQPDGQIVVGGSATSGTRQPFAAARFDATGALDATFGTNGIALLDPAVSGLDFAHTLDVTVAPGGAIVLAGSAWDASNDPDVAVVRLTAAGAPDGTFGGGNGLAIVALDTRSCPGQACEQASSVRVAWDGTLLVGGFVAPSPTVYQHAVVRLLADGSPDTSFGSNGSILRGAPDGTVADVAFQADGKILVAGGEDSQFSLSRYESGAVRDASFTLESPLAGAEYRIGGNPLKPIWVSPAPSPAFVNVYLLKGDAPAVLLYSGPNLVRPDFGAGRYVIPAGTEPGSDYVVRVEDALDPFSAGESAPFTILPQGGTFVVESPTQGQFVALGASPTVEWAATGGAVGGTVQIDLIDRATSSVVETLTTANDGSEPFAIPSSAAAGVYSLSITSVESPTYARQSRSFRVGPVGVSAPARGTVWTEGQAYTIAWDAPTITDPAAAVRISVRRAGASGVLVTSSTENDGSFEWTVPVGTVSASDYYVHVQIVSNGGATRDVAKSGLFGIAGTGFAPAPVATAHFVAPAVTGSDEALLTVAAPHLADGSEVAAFAGDLLVGTGLVADGAARVAVRGTVVDPARVAAGLDADGATVTLADGTPLTLRAWSLADGDAPLETETRVDDAGTALPALVFVDGSETTVTLKGETSSDEFALTGVVPNPTTGGAVVRFTLPSEQAVMLAVYDMLGREVVRLVDAVRPAGSHVAVLDAGALASGAYTVRLTAGSSMAVRLLTVVR